MRCLKYSFYSICQVVIFLLSILSHLFVFFVYLLNIGELQHFRNPHNRHQISQSHGKNVRQRILAHGVNEPEAATVFFGGGTPTILKASDLVAMLNG